MRSKVVFWIPALLWMSAIFLFSTDFFAAPVTASVMERILRFLFPMLSEDVIHTTHIALRKVGHVSSYGLLAATYSWASIRSIEPCSIWTRKKAALVFGLSLLYAASDEWHQSFSTLRTATSLDLGWDAIGAGLTTQVMSWMRDV